MACKTRNVCQDQPMLKTLPPLEITVLRDLRADPLSPAPLCLSAARGLVRVKGRLFIPADGLFQLGMVEEAPEAPEAEVALALSLIPLFDGPPPAATTFRAKGKPRLHKPDLDTLATLPPLPGCPHGALLALACGAHLPRETGLLIVLDAQGHVTERLAHIDLGPVYEPLRQRFDDLNIEGVFFASGELRLLHRGNRGDARNACITFDMNHIGPWLTGQSPLPPPVKAVQKVALGNLPGALAGFPLGLTDGAALPGGAWAFSAVAVQPRHHAQAGECVGSVVGVVGPDGKVQQMHTLAGALNVTGIAAQVEGSTVVLTLVTTAADRQQPAQLLRVSLVHSN